MAIFQKKTWGVFFIVSLIFLLSSRIWAASATHFSCTPNNFPAFFYGGLAIGTQGPAVGDELGVFDNTVTINGGCVGAVVITEEMAAEGGYSVSVYGDDTSTTTVKDGAASGDALTFRLWRAADGAYYDCGSAAGGAGGAVWPGSNETVVLDLVSSSAEANPVAYFTYTPAVGGCAPSTVQFTDASTGGPTAWSWNFGDDTGAGASVAQSPSHIFAQAGTYTVTLTVTKGTGGATSTYSQTITVSAKPTANFTISATSGNKPMVVNFTDTSTNAPSGTTWAWNFGDGASSSAQNPTHTYTAKGTYKVTLTVTNACGSDTKESADITVAGAASGLAAKFTASTLMACAAEEIAFSAKESVGDIVSWQWSFGDSATSTEKEPVHAYDHSGLYTISLIVKNSQGEDDTLTQKEWIRIDSKPIANFQVDKASICPGESVQFTDISSGAPIRWRWNFGDGWISNKQSPTHIYEKPGNYVVRLISSSMCGFSLEQKTSYVEVKSPEVDFDASQGGDCQHLTVSFTGKSIEGDSVSNCKWVFGGTGGGAGTGTSPYSGGIGDSGTSGTGGSGGAGSGTGTTFAYTFPKPGIYSVKLTADTPCGTVTKIKDVTVTGPLSADFGFSANPGTVNETITFTDKSTGGPTAWHWEFGDAGAGGTGQTTSSLKNPTFKYAAAGAYTVSMTVSNDCGSKTTTRNIIIGADGTSVIGVESSVCANIPVKFINASPATVTEFQWDFGDNSPPSTVKSPEHTYAAAGAYQVTLTAGGVPYTRLITVRDRPTISANSGGGSGAGAASGGCAPLTVHFTGNAGVGSGGGSSTWLWDFGDGKESTELNPVHTYTEQGTYTAVLKTDCGLSNEIPITVKDTLQADFSATALSGKAPLAVTFQNKSIGADDFAWDFGDGETSSSENPSAHTYSRPGSYKAYLIVDNGQCEDEKSVWVDVYTLNSISGKVLNSKNGTTIADAQVQIVGEILNCVSASNGDYSFSGLRPGTYAMLVTAPGFESKLVQQVRVKLGKDAKQDIVMTPAAGTIEGNVTGTAAGGAAGAVEGVTVVAMPMSAGLISLMGYGPDYVHCAVTDSEGNYSINVGQEGTYKLMASKEGFSSKTDNKAGQGYEINYSVKEHTVNMTLETRPWLPKVNISSVELQGVDGGASGEKKTEIYIYTDQNLPDANVNMTAINDLLGGDFSSAVATCGDSNRPCYKVIYSGYDAAGYVGGSGDDNEGAIQQGIEAGLQIMAFITFTNGDKTVKLPYAFPVCPDATGSSTQSQEKCLKKAGNLIVPAQGGRIEGLGWIDLNQDGKMDVYDNSFIELPVCTSLSNDQGGSSLVVADSPVMACMDRRINPSINGLNALYNVELMDPNGNRIGDSDLSIKDENPVIVHLHFDPASFEGSMGDLVIKYRDQADGTWKNAGTTTGAGGLKNIHIVGSNLVFTTTRLALLNSFGLFSINGTPTCLILNQDSSSLTRLNLMWLDNSIQDIGFEIWNCINEENPKRDIKYALLATAGPNETQFDDAGCELGKTYSYKVRALTDLGATAFSSHASMQVVECNSIPLPPRDLKVQTASKNQVVLAWIDQSACESGFEIYRKNGETGTFTKIGTITGNSYTDKTVKPSSKYFYVVKAKSNQGDSDSSNEVAVTTAKKSSSKGGMCFISSIASSWASSISSSWAALSSSRPAWSTLLNRVMGK